jgi:dihydroxyacetone kinase
MTWLVNDPALFVDEALSGIAAARPEKVAAVWGGLVRSTETSPGQVAVVMGGGSGHFPAFAGWVGPGFGSGAACGNVFASPSESQIYSVARASDSGGGVLFVPINYAGDILHFTRALERLRSEGVDARMVVISDDIASAPSESRAQRRGIAGSFIALKMIGAAAERGGSLDEVEDVAVRANDAIRSFGIAFSGCTLPGAAQPLFTVPEGKMALGLGIHGERGISEVDRMPANGVADLLLDGLFDERKPESGRAVAVLVNGLGGITQDELHVVFGRVKARLESEGMRVIEPVIDSQVTSFDMAGVSLSLAYLEDGLEALWLAPADTISFSRGTIAGRAQRSVVDSTDVSIEIPWASAVSRHVSALVVHALRGICDLLSAEAERLGAIDAVAGDGDHGIGMERGSAAAVEAASNAASRGAGAGTTLRLAGQAWSDRGGGTSGALWGRGLVAVAAIFGDDSPITDELLVGGMDAFGEAVRSAGAVAGDKTMVDAMLPFEEAVHKGYAEKLPAREVWSSAAAASSVASEHTSEMVARLGRSRLHGERSLGTPDAGAVSFALIVSFLAESLG